MVTKFALARLDVDMPDGSVKVAFYFDGNGKITRQNSNFAKPVPNAFSLVQVEDCPFATPICKSVCYVHRMEQAEQEVHAAYRNNSQAIRQVLDRSDWRLATISAFADWISSNASKGFRWHVSGDIFSLDYARFIRDVCLEAKKVPFWIYTRSFQYVKPLLAAKNLVVNLSADKDNLQEALITYQMFGLRLCYLTVAGEVPVDLPEGSVIFPSHELRGIGLVDPKQAPWWQSLSVKQRHMVCPPDFFGQSESLRCGPCKKCLI